MECLRCARLTFLSRSQTRMAWRQLSVQVKQAAGDLPETPSIGNTVINQTPRIGNTVMDQKQDGILRISNSGKRWESVIGVEVHAQILSNSKLFSNAPNKFNQPVNTQVSYFDAAIPGTLPVLNFRCVEAGIRTSLALKADVNLISYFDRKHYFYADLPAGYQITQQRKPISQNGAFTFDVKLVDFKKEYSKTSELVQIQIEQDSGKSLHDDIDGNSLVDLNRCGVGLLELVFAPDLRHGDEAAALAKELALVLQTLNTCGGRMERGELRVDANVSVRQPGDQLGTRTEIKNLNSIRSVSRAIEFEVWRQIEALERGELIENETRGFDVEMGRTLSMRDKERKQDYRFMPEPNLPPLVLDPEFIRDVQSKLPQLPSESRIELENKFGLSKPLSRQIVDAPEFLQFFKECTTHNPLSHKAVANALVLIVQEYLLETDSQLISSNQDPSQEDNDRKTVSLSAKSLVECVNMKEEKLITHTALRNVVREILSGNRDPPSQIVQDKDWYIIIDPQYIEKFVDDVLSANADTVERYLSAKPKRRHRHMSTLMAAANMDPRVESVNMAIFTNIITDKLDKMKK